MVLRWFLRRAALTLQCLSRSESRGKVNWVVVAPRSGVEPEGGRWEDEGEIGR